MEAGGIEQGGKYLSFYLSFFLFCFFSILPFFHPGFCASYPLIPVNSFHSIPLLVVVEWLIDCRSKTDGGKRREQEQGARLREQTPLASTIYSTSSDIYNEKQASRSDAVADHSSFLPNISPYLRTPFPPDIPSPQTSLAPPRTIPRHPHKARDRYAPADGGGFDTTREWNGRTRVPSSRDMRKICTTSPINFHGLASSAARYPRR